MNDLSTEPEVELSPITPVGVWLRLVGGNAFLISLLYLGTGLAAELLRQFHNTRTVARLLATLEQTPGRVLDLLGLLEPLREAYSRGQLSSFGVRWAYGITMMTIITCTAAMMALLMALAQRAWVRWAR